MQKILNHNAHSHISLLEAIYEKQINLINLQSFWLGKPQIILDLLTVQWNLMTTPIFLPFLSNKNFQVRESRTFFFFQFFSYNFNFIYLFIYLFLAVLGLRFCARATLHHGARASSLSRPLLLRGTGSRRTGSVIVAHGPSCSTACGIFPDQGLNPCPLHWQAESQPLRHQGSPELFLIDIPKNVP